jgi:DNA-binding NarL/FixJ family response regulator
MRARFEPPHATEALRIFVVESDEVVRSALRFILEDRGEARGFASLDQAVAEDLTPDIVLLGISFVQDGEGGLTRILRHWPGAKILIVANSVNDRLARSSLKWGAHGVLGKPITHDNVRQKVDTVLGDDEFSPTLLALRPLSAAW